jgi:hypothetical protein
MSSGPNIVRDGLVFHYDLSDGKSFAGEPTTNYIYHQNPRIDGTYTSYMPESAQGTIAVNHPQAIRVYNTDGNDISYYLNTGVGDWTNARHAYWIYDNDLKKPVVQMYDTVGTWQAKYLGSNMSAWSSYGMTAGSKYTISWLQWTTSTSKYANVGFYSKDLTNNWNFWDGLSSGSATSQNTKTHTWERVYHTYTVSASRDLNNPDSNVYFYNGGASSNHLRIADVQLELKDHPTKFSPTLTRSSTMGLFDRTRNVPSINSSTVSYNSNGKIIFDGTDDYINLPASSWNILTTHTLEGVFKSNGAPGSGYHVLFQKEGGYSGGAVYGLRCNPNGGQFYTMICYDNEAASQNTLGSSTTLEDGQWYHVVSTFDSSYNWRLYINGTLENSATLSRVPYQNSSAITIGQGDGRKMNGELDIMRIYNYALSEQEVLKNFSAIRGKYNL